MGHKDQDKYSCLLSPLNPISEVLSESVYRHYCIAACELRYS